ncbi:MAG: response regulator [Desulfuromonadales bacterium]|nr:MAG: response regulator [Desulfuromonadales bacterium]
MENSPEKRVLVVDDTSPSRKGLARILEKGGFAVAIAPSGEEALKAVQATPFNIVVTDVTLPGMSGLNLLKLVKECKPDLELIIVTSNASSYTAIKALRLGAYDFIIEPVDDPAILLNIVERALEKQTLTLENRRLIGDLKERNRELNDALHMMKTANRLCAGISASLDAGDILRKLVEGAVEELHARKGYLLLPDREGHSFSMKVSVGISRELAMGFRLRWDQGLSGLVATNGKALAVGGKIPAPLAPRTREEDPTGELFTPPDILSVPLRVKDKVAGVLTVSGRVGDGPFTDAEAEFLSIIVNHAAIALDNAGSYYKLKKKEI